MKKLWTVLAICLMLVGPLCAQEAPPRTGATPGTFLDPSHDMPSGSGGSPPGGLTTQVQFNDGNLFNGDLSFTFDKITKMVTSQSLTVGIGGLFIIAPTTAKVTSSKLGRFQIETPATGTGNVFSPVAYWVQANLDTADATTTTAQTIATATGSVYIVTVKVLAMTTNASTVSGFELTGVFRNQSGSVAQMATTKYSKWSGSATQSVIFTTSGANILIQVTGTAAVHYTWNVTTEVEALGYVSGT